MNLATGQLCKAPPSGITGLTCDLYPLSTSGGKYSSQKEGTEYDKKGNDYPQPLLNSNFLLKSYGPLQCWPKVEFVRSPLGGSSEDLYDSFEPRTYSPPSIDSDMSYITKHFNGHEGDEDIIGMTNICDDIKMSNGINRCNDVNRAQTKNKTLQSQPLAKPIAAASSGGVKARRPLHSGATPSLGVTPSSGLMKRNNISKSNGTEPLATRKISSTRRISTNSSVASTGNVSGKTNIGSEKTPSRAMPKSDRHSSKLLSSNEKLSTPKPSFNALNGSRDSDTRTRKSGVSLIETLPSPSIRKSSAGIGSRTSRPSTGSRETTPTIPKSSKPLISPSVVNPKNGTKVSENVSITSSLNKTDSPESRPTSARPTKSTTAVTSRYSAERSTTENDSRKRRTEYEKTRINNEKKREEKSDIGRKQSREEEKRKLSKEERKRIEETRKQLLEKREKAKESKIEGNREQKKASIENKSRLKKSEEPKGKEQNKVKEKEHKKNSVTERRTTENNQQNLQIVCKNENDLEGSDGELYTMVQENGMMKVVSKASPLKPIRSPLTSDQDVDKLEQEKKERIQRYKEERRKQMAARYGTIEPSSSDEENSNATQSANRRRRRHRPGLDSSSTDLSTGEGRKNRENGSFQDLNIQKAKEGSSSEDLRNRQSAKRLDPLNGSTTILTSPTLVAKNAKNAASASRDDNKRYLRRETVFDQSLQRIASQEGRVDSADSTLSGSDGRGGRRRRTSTEEKDKSYKRKSHLNRASTSEEAVYPPQNISQLSDSSEDAPRRRRRRTPTASDNPFTSSPPVTPPTTGIVDSPISRIGQAKKSQVAQPPSLLPPLKSPSLLTAHGLPSTGSHSAPSTLDARPKSDVSKTGTDAEETAPKNSFANKLTPLKITPLRKPDIPSVLRPKEPTVLTSPGVLRTPSSSRPSSVVIEKPPVRPEGNVSRIPSTRSSLRKNFDSGTCFMASRREKRLDETSDQSLLNSDLEVGDQMNAESHSSTTNHLNQLTAQALELKSRAEELSEETMVQECERYLHANKENIAHRSSQPKGTPAKIEADVSPLSGPLSGGSGLTSDTGQKNWVGGPEGNGDKVIRRLAFEEEVKEKFFSSDAAPASGPPYYDDNFNCYRMNDENSDGRHVGSLEGTESPPRTRSPLDSILKRRSSREDSILSSSSDKSSQGILKKVSPRGSSSFDNIESDPRPILKKRSSADEDSCDPKSILKKKSLTDDEFEYERPRSILKGSRSREDLMDRSEGITSPTPILKRHSKGDSEGEGSELRPILKRRDTADGVRHSVHISDAESCETPLGRVRSDSAPDMCMLARSHPSVTLPATPTHGILKKRSTAEYNEREQSHNRPRRFAIDREEPEEPRRPPSPALVALNSAERPLSVAERIAGMEALQSSQSPPSPGPLYSPGVRPKVRRSSEERVVSPYSSDRETRRSSWISPSRPENVSYDIENVAEPFQPIKFNNQASRVTQKAAFFSKLEQESEGLVSPRKDRGTRFSTQPVTEGEVCEANRIADGVSSRDSNNDTTVPEGLSQSATECVRPEGSVGARVAMWSKRLEELQSKPSPPSIDTLRRKARSARFRTQPITLEEVAQAHELNNQETTNQSQARVSIKSSAEIISNNRFSGESFLLSMGRRASAHDLTYNDSGQVDAIRSILKNEHSRDRSKESPRSILKPDSRRSSMCESEHPKGILKSESPLTSTVVSPEHEGRPLKSVLKKDSSVEDFKEMKEIKSILKPESECLEPEISSDSSSDLVQDPNCWDAQKDPSSECLVDTYNTVMTAGDYAEFCRMSRSSSKKTAMQKAVKQALPMKAKDNLAEALRQIEPIREKSKGKEKGRDEILDKENFKLDYENVSFSSKKVSHEETICNVKERSDKLDFAFFDHNGRGKQVEEVIDEMKSSFEENMRSITDLSHEDTSSRVTFRHKSQQKSLKHKERWTMNDFSSCDSPKNDKQSNSSDSSASSSPSTALTSPNAALPPTPPFSGLKESTGGEEDMGSGARSNLRSSPITIPPVGDSERLVGASTILSSSSASSINARLVALQKNGEDGWRSRLPKCDGDAELEILSPKLSRSKARPTSLMERVTQLETSSQQWKGRVSQSDATKFTVAHKMASATSVPSLTSSKTEETVITSSKVTTKVSGLLAPPLPGVPSGLLVSPGTERRRRTPLPKVFKSKTGSSIPDLLNRSATKETGARVAKEFSRSISVENETSHEELAVVNIPRLDDESFNAFFSSSSLKSSDRTSEVNIDYSDFDQITTNTTQLVVQKRNIRATRNYQTTKNPLKTLAARDDLKDEYIDVKLGAGERELRRMKVEELSKSSSFAMEALAGLASKENFSAVSLKKVEDNPVVRELAPFTDLMLLQVKGRKHPQVRVVEPCSQSVNVGDDFILVTPSELFHYKGEFSNVIERAVASEIASYILQTKDLGTASVLRVTDVHEASATATKERFWGKLGGDSSNHGMPAGPIDEDDDYEAAIVASNKIFEVKEEALVPIDDAWGLCPKYETLTSDKVLVFDFGSEVYLWGGKKTSAEDKKKGLQLLRELWKEEYDYSDCDINPIIPSTLRCSPNKSGMKGIRPKWGICGKITENVETILFKEKFADWPDTAQQTRIKEVRKEADLRVDPVNDVEPCNVRTMIETQPEDPELVLEMSHLGRGVEFYDEEERRMLSISTNEFKVWHIAENEKYLLSSESAVHFYSEETYVVRWYYHVTATGRTLKGTPSKHNVTGRSRVAYFFWQGKNSSISDKGVSALMTVELDEERGPHVRVTMGFEPPAFLNLFQGRLTVHNGKRGEAVPSNRLFIIRGEVENEVHLLEVVLCATHLRSMSCLVMVSVESGIVYLWNGCKATKQTKQIALRVARFLQQDRSSEIGWKSDTVRLKEEREGFEGFDFKSIIGFGNAVPYYSLLSEGKRIADFTTRIWKLDVSNDHMHASELVSTYRLPGTFSPFPIWQDEIYSVSQPALFLVDAGYKVFVWQGWFPDKVETEDEGSSATTGSAFLRFTFARRAALKTALQYATVKEDSLNSITINPPEMAIAGMESLEFSNLFPVWKSHPDVEAVLEKEGRWKKGVKYLVKDVHKQLCRNRYSLEELQKKPLPDGVDPSRLEKYLSDEEFEIVLGVDRESFVRLPSWKKLHLKKKGNLF